LNLSREILYHRHRLSHQQIDQLLGEQKSGDFLLEKLAQMEQLREFFRITDALKEAGISFICLKGPLLSQRIYGDPAWRIYNDFDFLIEPGGINEVLTIMDNMGYSSTDFQIPSSKKRKVFLIKYLNELMVYNSQKNTGVEIHWRLFSGRIVKQNDLKSIIDNNFSGLSIGGRSFKVFSPELELLYLIMHGGFHAYRRMKWLLDIKDFLENVPYNEDMFVELTQKLRAMRLITLTNALLQYFFPGSKQLPANQKVRRLHLAFCLQEINTEKDEDTKSLRVYFQRFRFALGVIPGLKYKLSVIKNNLLATDSINSKYIPCVPFIYFLIGPFWKLWRGFR